MLHNPYGHRIQGDLDIKFDVIEIDAPWNERGGGRIKRGADRHYPLLSEHEIIETILRSPVWRPSEHAHLFSWVTNNHLESGLFVMRALGFRYVTNVAWCKDRVGLGQYFRGQHELCLFGVRTKGRGTFHRTEDRSIASVIQAPRTKHSAKPPEFYEMIEARSSGRRLSMFARGPRDGWWTWGNETTKPETP